MSNARAKLQLVQAPLRSTGGLALQRACACGQHSVGGGECEACQKQRLQRSGFGNAPDITPPIVHTALAEQGQPLDSATRAFMEPRFGRDLSAVRVHTGGRAAESARAVGALAYTVGQQIVFNTGQYAPGTTAGRRLLAHELAHTVQQGGGQLRRQGGPARPGKKSGGASQSGQKSAGPATLRGRLHASLARAKINTGDMATALSYVQTTPVGKEVLTDLGGKGIQIAVIFYASHDDLPDPNHHDRYTAGYFEELGEKSYALHVIAVTQSTESRRNPSGSIDLIPQLIPTNAQSVADTIFHELLHVWFVLSYPDQGTGHSSDVKPTEEFLGVKRYDEENYNERFLARLKRFDAELAELRARLRKHSGGAARPGTGADKPPATRPDAGPAQPQTLQPKLLIGPADDPYERAADQAADMVMGVAPAGSLMAPLLLPAPRLQRAGFFESLARFFGGGTFEEPELLEYLQKIRRDNVIEDAYDSDNKARAVVARWKRGDEKFAILTMPIRILLIKEMLSGFVGNDDERAILDLLEEVIESERETILDEVGIPALEKAFHGDEHQRLRRLLSDQEDLIPLSSMTAWSVGSVMEIVHRHGDASSIKFILDKGYTIISFKRAFMKWRYPDGTVKEQPMAGLRGSTRRDTREIRINANLSTTEAAATFVHEVNHAMRPQSTTTDEYLEEEIGVRVATEEFRIRHGLRPTKPGYRRADGTVDRDAIEKDVKGSETYNPPTGQERLGTRYEDEQATKGWRMPDTRKRAKP